MAVKAKWDVICGEVLWEVEFKGSPEAIKFRLGIFMVVVVVMGVMRQNTQRTFV